MTVVANSQLAPTPLTKILAGSFQMGITMTWFQSRLHAKPGKDDKCPFLVCQVVRTGDVVAIFTDDIYFYSTLFKLISLWFLT